MGQIVRKKLIDYTRKGQADLKNCVLSLKMFITLAQVLKREKFSNASLPVSKYKTMSYSYVPL